jgi:K+-sensing histidine kinase KdpD
MLIAGMAILRYLVDRPPVSLADTLACTLFLLAAMRWGGLLATIIAILVIIGTDYFLIDPISQLSVASWKGMLEVATSAAIGTSVGIIATRFFRPCRNKSSMFVA